MQFFEKTKEFVTNSFAGIGEGVKHFEETVKWIKHLKPDADEALLTAGFAHDIERAFGESKKKSYLQGASLVDKKVLKKHQEVGGKLIFDFLKKEGARDSFAAKVRFLIAHHEIGGTLEADVLKDADSLSYFESNAAKHAEWVKLGVPKANVLEKFDFMFNRISSDAAKKIARPHYDAAVKLLG